MNPDVKIIIKYSGRIFRDYLTKDEIQRCKAMGAVGYLPTELTKENVIAEVNRVFNITYKQG